MRVETCAVLGVGQMTVSSCTKSGTVLMYLVYFQFNLSFM